MFPFIFLIATQFFFLKLFNNDEINIFKYSGLKNIKYDKYKYLIFLFGLGLIILSESSLGYISNNLNKNILILILPIILTLFIYLIFIHKLRLFYKITK